MDSTRHGMRNSAVTILAGVGFAVVLLGLMALVGVTLLGGAVTAGLAGRALPPGPTRPAHSARPVRPASASVRPGTALWQRQYHGETAGLDSAASIALSPNGRIVYTTGSSAGPAGQPGYVTVAYNAATGTRLWASRYDAPGGGASQPASIAISPAGTAVYVTGTSEGTTTGADFATAGYDATTGAQLWVRRWAGPGAGTDKAVAVSVGTQGGTVLVTGTSTARQGSAQVTIAYDAATGAKLWLARYAAGDQMASALAIGPLGGTVYVTGSSRTPQVTNFVTIAYDITTGAQRWAATYQAGPGGSDPADQPHAIAVSPDGNDVVVTGTGGQAGTATAHDYATVGYDALTGGQLWAVSYNGPGSGLDEAHSVAISPDSHLAYVTGASTGISLTTSYATIAYDTQTGAVRWIARYGANASAREVIVSPDGNSVYVTGITAGGGTARYTTIGYDALSGGQNWTATFSQGSDGVLQSLAISRTGAALYFASTANANDGDLLTIAYKA